MIDVKKEVENIYEQVVGWRRDFHMHPEVGYHEERTSKKVADTLRSFGLEVKEGVGGYGIVGLLKGACDGKTIAIRADMDALPLQEKNTFEYASKIDGVMHACGHDGHTAALLGTAAVLCKMKDELKGNVKFIFQPAEEVAPIGGAKPMVETGAMENPKVDAIIGLHIEPYSPSGTITLGKGPVSTAADNITIEVFGKGGHGATPHVAKDALLAACQIVNSLQMIVSRCVDPMDTAVVTIGKLESGTACNIIADYAKMEGTVRTLNPNTQSIVREAIENIIEGVAKTTGTTVKLDYKVGYPAVINDSDMIDMVKKACLKFLAPEAILTMAKPNSGSEDFSNYLVNGVPGAFFDLGAGIDGQEPISHHHPKFNWDENAMKTGMQSFIMTVIEYLN